MWHKAFNASTHNKSSRNSNILYKNTSTLSQNNLTHTINISSDSNNKRININNEFINNSNLDQDREMVLTKDKKMKLEKFLNKNMKWLKIQYKTYYEGFLPEDILDYSTRTCTVCK
jgi:hypothetical protein